MSGPGVSQTALIYHKSSALLSIVGGPAPACLLLVASLACGGCVQTSMTLARQIEPGTTVVSARLDEPGFAYIPRLNAQLTHGLGDGDLTTNVSFPALIGVGAGLTGRHDLTGRLTGGLQLQDGFFRSTAALALVRVQGRAARAGDWYVGNRVGAPAFGPSSQRVEDGVGYGPGGRGEDRIRADRDWDELADLAELEPNAPRFPTANLAGGLPGGRGRAVLRAPVAFSL